jgi:hypothetical protein
MSNGFTSAINVTVAGQVKVGGFSTDGKGPSTDLGLFQITFTAVGRGTSNLGVTIDSALADANTTPIGTSSTRGGSITVN